MWQVVVLQPHTAGALTQTHRSDNDTPVTFKIVLGASPKRAKGSWVCQVMHGLLPVINRDNAFSTACKHMMRLKPSGGTKEAHYQEIVRGEFFHGLGLMMK